MDPLYAVPHIFCGQKCEQGHIGQVKCLIQNRKQNMHKISSLDHIAGVCVQNRPVLHDFFCLSDTETKKIHIFTFFVDKIVMKHVLRVLSH
jgi:hypothetical protein